MRYVFFMLWIGLTALAQTSEHTVFESPLDINLTLSGTFGELRNNHFHSGLDIRTQQKTGFPIRAPQDGEVSRIKVSSFGYGKALYLEHPGGITTVYGHLEAYHGLIADYVLERHYSDKQFEIEMFPRKGTLRVKKGDIIGYTGNSGGSGGPHLHYEFRDTKTQKILNPLGQGMDKFIVDTKAPVVTAIVGYAVGKGAAVDANSHFLQVSFKRNGSTIVADPVQAKGLIGFGITAYDKAEYSNAKNGIYSVEALLNGKRIYGYRFDTFSFDESRYVNALLDYEAYQKTKTRIQKAFYEKPYPLSVIQNPVSNGLIDVKANESYTYKMIVSDFFDNETTIIIPIVYGVFSNSSKDEVSSDSFFINSDKEYVFEEDNYTIEMPSKAFYNDFHLDLSVVDGVLKLHNNYTPIHKNITISLKVAEGAVSNPSKTYLGRTNGNQKQFYQTSIKGNTYRIKTRDFGDYSLVEDLEHPIIYDASFKDGDWLSEASAIHFHIKDLLSGISTYTGTINGKWALFDYDYKTNRIVHLFQDGVVTSGRNDVQVKVRDKVGNEMVLDTYFFRK